MRVVQWECTLLRSTHETTEGAVMADHGNQAEHTKEEHAHGQDCGHEAVQHDDHVDYLHDGHKHAEHEDHYDEH